MPWYVTHSVAKEMVRERQGMNDHGMNGPKALLPERLVELVRPADSVSKRECGSRMPQTSVDVERWMFVEPAPDSVMGIPDAIGKVLRARQ
jgi:hypothetical protein